MAHSCRPGMSAQRSLSRAKHVLSGKPESLSQKQKMHFALTAAAYLYENILSFASQCDSHLFILQESADMRTLFSKVAVVIILLSGISSLRADDLRAAMEAANAQWLTAFNTPNPAAFPDLYTLDAVLLFQGSPTVRGAEAIGQFWAARIKLGVRDHGFELLDTWADGNHAYQWARASAVLVKPTGERITFVGNTVRNIENQNDGTWKTKIHMYNRPE